MKKIVAVMLVSMAMMSCKHEDDAGKFKLNGDIKNVADQKIYLEQLFFSQKDPEVLDTADIKNGKFELSAIAQEEGIFRLRFEKLEHGFIFINDKPSINFKADIKNVSLDGPDFSSPANHFLKRLMIDLTDKTTLITAASTNLDSLKKAGNNDSMVNNEMARLNELSKSYKDFILKFIDTASDPVVAMFALGSTNNIDPASLKEIVPNLAKRFPAHQGVASLVLQYNQFINKQNQPQPAPANGAIAVGSIAPDITMNDTNGKPFSLSSLKGKYVLVDFWASWCGPCRGENPNVVVAYQKYKDKNFTILGVSLDDDKAAWLKAIKDDGLSWKQISDLKGWGSAAAPLYGFDGIPYNVLLDPEGKIIATSLRGPSLEAKLAEVLP